MSVVDGSFDQPLPLAEHATMPLAGGIEQMGYQCGMLWGAALAAGSRAHELLGPTPRAEAAAVSAAQRLVQTFQAQNKHINCSDITQIEWKSFSKRGAIRQVLKFFLKGGPILCFSMSANYARAAFDEIDSFDFEKQIEPTGAPVSCAAVLARRMGASHMHAVMAAGLAGGIGLSGGGCGALGAAIWIHTMGILKDGAGKIEFNSAQNAAVLERFLESTDYEFECAAITGRKFADVGEHAAYLREGGCAKVIEALAG